VHQVSNDAESIGEWLESFEGLAVAMAVEATNDYHEELVSQAQACGYTVYLVDGYRVKHYREAIGWRAKTDGCDARLLARYVASERGSLRAVQEVSAQERALWRLMKRRAKVVSARAALVQSLGQIKHLGDVEEAFAALDRLVKALEGCIRGLARAAGWGEALGRLRTIPGVGELSALALRAMYGRGAFRGAEAFIAFIGLDVRVRDSGTFRGQRKLTKRGDAEVRRVLFNAARSAARTNAHWATVEARYRARGLSTTASSVAVARKLARIAFAVLRDGSAYDEAVLVGQSPQ
jgi:transposase